MRLSGARGALGVSPGALSLLAVSLWAGGFATDCTCARRRGAAKRSGPAVVLVDPEQAQGIEHREVEPNEDQSRAQPLALGEAIRGTLKRGRPDVADQDWYVVKVVDGDQSLRADLSGVPGVDVRLEAFSAAGQWLVKVDNSGASGGEVLLGLYASETSIFLRVTGVLDGKTKRKGLGDYRLSVNTRPRDAGEEREPNWKQELATEVGSEGEAVGQCGWRSDEDWYVVELPASGQPQLLRVEFDAPDGLAPSFGVRWSDGWIVEPRSVAAGETRVLANLRPPPGATTLHVRIRCGRSYDLDSRYALRVSTSPARDSEVEPNDVPAAATLLPVGRRLSGILADQRDRDLYRVPSERPGGMRLVVDPPGGLDPVLELLDADGAILQTVNNAPAGKREVLQWSEGPGGAGTLVAVRAARAGAADPSAVYRVEANPVTAEDWEIEPNDVPEQANPWPAKTDRVRGVLSSGADRDCFVLPAGLSSTRLSLTFRGDLNPVVELLDGDTQAVLDSARRVAGHPGVTLVATLVPSRRYRLRVKHHDALTTGRWTYSLSYSRVIGPAPLGPAPGGLHR